MTYNIINVSFGALRKITGPFISYQYDVQQILVINGLNLPEYYEVDFCNEGDTYTETIVGTAAGVAIPNKFLRTGKKVKAYLVLVGDGDVQTRYEITLPVSVRPQRQDIDPTDDQQLQIDSLVAALNSGVSRAEDAASVLENASADAETLSAGEEATAEYRDGVFHFGIPEGQQGRGEKGDSAVVYTLEPTMSAIPYDPNASFAGASITVNAYRTTGQGVRESFTAQEFHLLVGTASKTIARQDVLNASSATLIIPSTATPDMHVTGYISAWVNNQRVTLATVEVPFIREGLDGTDGETVRPYIIEASAGAITYNPNATAGSRVSQATVTFNVYRGNVDGTRTVQTVDTIIAFFAQADGTEIAGRIMTDASSLTINSPQELPVGSYLCCRISDGSTVLRELRIPVIHDGVDGADGADGASDAERVTYDPTATYTSGTVGAELGELSRHLSDLEDSISDAYDATASYAVGDFCIYDNTLYRCNTAIPTGGEVWTPAHWDAVQIVDLLGSGGGDVTDVQINGTSILSGGVANVPLASSSDLGVVKQDGTGYSVRIDSLGRLSVVGADAATIKNADPNIKRPIIPSTTHIATFYGLAKAAGDTTQSQSSNPVGTYTDEAKSAIHEMLNGAVTVSGTTPTIAAKSGITYVCGEVATLDITLPASGIFEVQFVSGSTPTVLTATGVTWANGFDPTALEANKTYDISVSNGIGVAVWI